MRVYCKQSFYSRVSLLDQVHFVVSDQYINSRPTIVLSASGATYLYFHTLLVCNVTCFQLWISCVSVCVPAKLMWQIECFCLCVYVCWVFLQALFRLNSLYFSTFVWTEQPCCVFTRHVHTNLFFSSVRVRRAQCNPPAPRRFLFFTFSHPHRNPRLLHTSYNNSTLFGNLCFDMNIPSLIINMYLNSICARQSFHWN